MSDWSNVDNSELGEDDFQAVLSAVADLAGLWHSFASSLGLSPLALLEIDAAERGIPARCLFAAITRWLWQDYNYQKFGVPSWQRLASAVESSSGGQNAALARKIAQDHLISPEPSMVIPMGEPESMPLGAIRKQVEFCLQGQQEVSAGIGENESVPTPMEQKEGQQEVSAGIGENESVPTPMEQKEPKLPFCEPVITVKQVRPASLPRQPILVISMRDLQNDLALVAHKWYAIGLQLGIHAHELDKIKGEGSNSQRLLTDVLHHWLSNTASAKKSDVELMLKSNTISEAKLARKFQNLSGIPGDIVGELKDCHLSILAEFLNPIASKWEDIGIQLGVDPRHLDILKQGGGVTPETYLGLMLRKLDSMDPPLTVNDLVMALSSGSVAEKVYAEMLEEKYGKE